MIFKLILAFSFLLNIGTSIAQTSNQNLEWRALNSFLNEEYDEAIVQCNRILETHKNDVVANRTRFILARTLIQTEKYEEALEVLNETKLDAAFFALGIEGLIGDCKSEQGKFEEALSHYLKAVHWEFNESLTPYYLFKSYLSAKQLNRPIEANKYIQTIENYFPSYAGQHQIFKYLVIDSVSGIQLFQPEATQPETFGIGTLNGKQLSEEYFQMALEIARLNALQTAQQQGQEPQIVDEDRVWKSFVEETALDIEYDRLKLYTDEEEFDAYLYATDGYSPQAEFLNSSVFTDDEGNFSPKKLRLRVEEMKSAVEPEQVEAWENTSDYYQKKLRQEKYFNLIGMIPFVTNLEIQQELADLKTYSAEYYCERFRDINDEFTSPTEAELKEFYEKNKTKPKYQNTENSHRILFVSEEIAPTKADTTAAFSEANLLKKAFKKAKDDSTFVIKWSDLKFYTSGPYSTAVPENHRKATEGRYLTYPISVSEEMESGKIGSIVGPYLFEGKIVVSKIIGRTDEIINARHILLSVHDGDYASADKQAQEILKSITNENFGDFVTKYSGDIGSSSKGGYLGDFFFGDMVPQFATYCADAPIGQIGIVHTQYGVHIVQVTKREGMRLPRLAPLWIPIKLSEESYTLVENRTNSIRSEYESELKKNPNIDFGETFARIAESKGSFAKTIEMKDNSPQVYGFYKKSAEDKLIEFAYDPSTSVGAISPIFTDSLNRFLCVLESVNKKGIPTYNGIKDCMHSDLVLDKKSELLRNRLISQPENGIEKKKVQITQSIGSIEGAGFEPQVIGKAIAAFHSGQKETVIRGNSGIFSIEVTQELTAKDEVDLDQLKNSMHSAVRREISNSIRRSLIPLNCPVDNRRLYRLGLRP